MGADFHIEAHKNRVTGIGDGLDEVLGPVIAGIDMAFHRIHPVNAVVIALADELGIFRDQALLQTDGGGDGFEHRARLIKVRHRLVTVLLVAGLDDGLGLFVP